MRIFYSPLFYAGSYLDEQILHNQIFKGANKKLKGNVTSSKSKVLYLDRKLKEKLKMMEDLGISLQLHLPVCIVY